jgi:hypothetical protein
MLTIAAKRPVTYYVTGRFGLLQHFSLHRVYRGMAT